MVINCYAPNFAVRRKAGEPVKVAGACVGFVGGRITLTCPDVHRDWYFYVKVKVQVRNLIPLFYK